MRTRCLLHRSDLKDFETWACANGFKSEPPKGAFEALRLRYVKEPRKDGKRWEPVLIYDRLRGDHFTVFGDGYRLVRAYYASKKDYDPAPSGTSRSDFW